MVGWEKFIIIWAK